MTPSARKELEELIEFIISKLPNDHLCDGGSAYLDGYTMALLTVKAHITRRLKAAKRKPDRIAKEKA